MRSHRLLPALLILLLVLLIFAYTRRELFYEKWLEAQSIERLSDIEQRRDADTLVHLIYAERLVDTGAVTPASQPITRAVETLAPSAPLRLSVRVFALAGYVAAQTGEYRRAEEYLQRAASAGQPGVALFLGLGILAIHRNQINDAVAALTTATRLAPLRAEAWDRLGTAFMLGSEPERAVDAFRHAVTLMPRNPRVHADLAQAFRGCRRIADEAAECRIAADLAPQDPNFTVLPAIAAANSARTDTEYGQALNLLREALIARAQDDRLRSILACLYIRFGRYAAARSELETCLAHNPKNAPGWDNLATVCTRLGDRRAAAAASARYQQLVEFLIKSTDLKKEALLHRTDPDVFLRLARLCRLAGKNREALGALEQAQRLRPDNPQIARDLSAVKASLQSAEAPTLQYPDGAEQN